MDERMGWPLIKLPFEFNRWMGEMKSADVSDLIFYLKRLVEAAEHRGDGEIDLYDEDVAIAQRLCDAYDKAVQGQFAGTRWDSRFSEGHQDHCRWRDTAYCSCEPFLMRQDPEGAGHDRPCVPPRATDRELGRAPAPSALSLDGSKACPSFTPDETSDHGWPSYTCTCGQPSWAHENDGCEHPRRGGIVDGSEYCVDCGAHLDYPQPSDGDGQEASS